MRGVCKRWKLKGLSHPNNENKRTEWKIKKCKIDYKINYWRIPEAYLILPIECEELHQVFDRRVPVAVVCLLPLFSWFRLRYRRCIYIFYFLFLCSKIKFKLKQFLMHISYTVFWFNAFKNIYLLLRSLYL